MAHNICTLIVIRGVDHFTLSPEFISILKVQPRPSYNTPTVDWPFNADSIKKIVPPVATSTSSSTESEVEDTPTVTPDKAKSKKNSKR